ncbi:MAG: decaprenyl-phosphate phosphoribosyltransferase [Acidimicrobiales bacterium]
MATEVGAASDAAASRPEGKVHGFVRALRPRQWAKNVLVFAAPVAAGSINEWSVLRNSLFAFVAFCLAASGTYLLNDARDVESDRLHPVKRNRPIASGVVSLPVAYGAGAVLVGASLAVGFATARNLGLTLLAYLVTTTTYSLWAKRQPVLDIVTVAAGFVLRAIAGAAATDLPISEWFFIVTSFGALLVVIGKREGEMHALGDRAASVRATLGAYTPEFLRYLRAVATGVVLVAYCLWAFESGATSPEGASWFKLSIVPFAIAIFQYGLILERGGGENPEEVLTSDRAILISGAVWAIIYGYAVYRT